MLCVCVRVCVYMCVHRSKQKEMLDAVTSHAEELEHKLHQQDVQVHVHTHTHTRPYTNLGACVLGTCVVSECVCVCVCVCVYVCVPPALDSWSQYSSLSRQQQPVTTSWCTGSSSSLQVPSALRAPRTS